MGHTFPSSSTGAWLQCSFGYAVTVVALGCCIPHRQAVAAAEAYIQQHGLDDVQIEVETRTMEELQEVS